MLFIFGVPSSPVEAILLIRAFGMMKLLITIFNVTKPGKKHNNILSQQATCFETMSIFECFMALQHLNQRCTSQKMMANIIQKIVVEIE